MKKTALPRIQISLIGFLFLTTASFSQSLSGTIYDSESGETLPFASIQIGESYGVISNNEGNFEIGISRFSPNDSLVFSFLGYNRKAKAIKDFSGVSGEISLTPHADMLSETFIISKNLNPADILKNVNKHLTTNYPKRNSNHTVFERNKNNHFSENMSLEIKKADFINKQKRNSINAELKNLNQVSKNTESNIYHETFYNLYQNEDNSIKTKIIKGTKLINTSKNTSVDHIQNRAFTTIANQLETTNTFNLRSGIIPIQDSLDLKTAFNPSKKIDSLKIKDKNKALSEVFNEFGFGSKSDFDFITDPTKYEYTIVKGFTYKDEIVYVLQFEPKKKNAKYSGEMYVSADSYAVLKANYRLAEGSKGDKANLKLLLGIKTEELDREILVIFGKHPQGGYHLQYLKANTEQYFYLNRSFSFTENNQSRKNRIKFKIDILAEGINKNENEYLFIDTKQISLQEFQNVSQETKAPIQIIEKYDPEIWKPYTILSPDQAIKDFIN